MLSTRKTPGNISTSGAENELNDLTNMSDGAKFLRATKILQAKRLTTSQTHIGMFRTRPCNSAKETNRCQARSQKFTAEGANLGNGGGHKNE
jgi:hypothetical protein